GIEATSFASGSQVMEEDKVTSHQIPSSSPVTLRSLQNFKDCSTTLNNVARKIIIKFRENSKPCQPSKSRNLPSQRCSSSSSRPSHLHLRPTLCHHEDHHEASSHVHLPPLVD
ncbi:hypothetical protein VIGAN_11194100, partial [Vigna angularis var. angularis]